jgi:hypothetical protein
MTLTICLQIVQFTFVSAGSAGLLRTDGEVALQQAYKDLLLGMQNRLARAHERQVSELQHRYSQALAAKVGRST